MIALRPLERDDARPLLALSVHPAQADFVTPNAVTLAEAPFTSGLSIFTILDGARPVGLLALVDFREHDDCVEGDDPEAAFMLRLMVDAASQGRGCGRAAVRFAIDWARRRGNRCLQTSISPGNDAARGLYASEGLRETGRVIEGEVQMELSLGKGGQRAGPGQMQPVTTTGKTTAGKMTAGKIMTGTIRGIEHIGITVPDHDAAVAFFAAAFGARVLFSQTEAHGGPFDAGEVGPMNDLRPGTAMVKVSMLRLEDGPNLEVFEVDRPSGSLETNIASYGIHHVSLTVADVEAAARAFVDAGGTLVSAPYDLGPPEDGPGNRGVFGRTPWGLLIEMEQFPAAGAVPGNRWLPGR